MRIPVLAATLTLAWPTWAQTPSTEAVAACEKAARETLRQSRGAMADATFVGAPAVQPGSTNGDEATLRGQGRYRGAVGSAPQPFSYRCIVHLKAGTVTGIVLRDAEPPRVTATPPQAGEPDLSRVAPEACDAAAASELKRRWPRLGLLQFNVGARRLESGAPDEILLSGQGAAVPSPGQPLTHFSYRCTVDMRSGHVVKAAVGP